MALRAWKETDPASQALAFLQELLRDYHPRDFAVELWDGTRWEPEASQFRRFDWKMNRPGALRAAFERLPANWRSGRSLYLWRFRSRRRIGGVFPLADYLLGHRWSKKEKLRLGAMLLALPRADDSHPPRPGIAAARTPALQRA